VEKHESNTPKQAGIGAHRDARGRWLPGVKQAPGPGRGYVGERSPQRSFAAYTDALREQISPELWAKKLTEACERGDMRALEYVGNRLLGMPHRAPEDTEAIRQGVQAQAQASALVVMVDGKAGGERRGSTCGREGHAREVHSEARARRRLVRGRAALVTLRPVGPRAARPEALEG
jgi:hypothetical protein